MNARRAAVRAALGLALVLMPVAPVMAQGQQGHGSGHQGMHAAPPSSGYRAELIRDVEQLESKFVGLAEAMEGKYGWRPAEGVRSVGEVFGHVAGANFMIPSMAGVAMPEEVSGGSGNLMQRMQELERSGDEAHIQGALRHSFMHLRNAIAEVPDAQLDEMTTMFGREVTKRQVLTLAVTHIHEHLGQAIAYARTNGVVPPWSGGE